VASSAAGSVGGGRSRRRWEEAWGWGGLEALEESSAGGVVGGKRRWRRQRGGSVGGVGGVGGRRRWRRSRRRRGGGVGGGVGDVGAEELITAQCEVVPIFLLVLFSLICSIYYYEIK
jgi:hypothetical protein